MPERTNASQGNEEPVLLNALVPVISAGLTFYCTPSTVWDGDGPVWCAEGPRIRIAGVAARELDGTCRNKQPCPSMSGLQARDRLVRLLGGPRGTLPTGHIKVRASRMTCKSVGSAGGSRTAAWCNSPDFGDLSCMTIRYGGAIKWARYWQGHKC